MLKIYTLPRPALSKIQNDPKAPTTATNIMSALQEQLANMQKSFIDALAQNQAAIAEQQAKQEAQHQESIKVL